MSTRIRILVIILIIWAIWGVIATTLLIIGVRGNSRTQIPAGSEVDVFYENGGPFITFPLTCPKTMLITEGPTWRNITIGESTIVDLEEIYGVQVTLEAPRLKGNFAPAYSILLTNQASMSRRLAQSADTCVVDGVIAALTISVANDIHLPGDWLADWVKIYGEPEIVTWTATGNDLRWRTLVWPYEGIALTVDAYATINNPTVGIVNSVTFFSPAQTENYISTWPYTSLSQTPPSTGITGYSEEQNPFDFDSMLEAE